MTRLFFQIVHLPVLTRERNEYFMWTLFYQKKKETKLPKQTKRRTQRNTHGMMKRNNDIAQLQVSLPRF